MRIATGGILHETNTFAEGTTPLEAFVGEGSRQKLLVGEEILKAFGGVGTATGGFIAVADELGFELAPLIRTFPQPSGIVEQDAYDELADMMIEKLAEAMPVDGVLLDLHGAMVTEELEDAEGDLLGRVRNTVGPDIPIVSTLDLHANITPAMTTAADVLVGYDTYPHVDCMERGVEAAQIMADTIGGRIRPVSGFAQVDMLIGPPKQCTLVPPMKDVTELVHEIEQRPGIISVTFAGGFPFSDIHDAGVSVVAHADGDEEFAQDAAEEIAEYVWSRREEFRLELMPVDEAIRFAIESGAGPVILADGSDNPGGGAPCDGTVMLAALIEAEAPRAAVALIADPEAVAEAIAAGVGNEVTLKVGGKTDHRHGQPLHLAGYVKLISDGNYINRGPMMTGLGTAMGRTVVFVVGEVEIVLTEQRIQPFDMEALRSLGIEPSQRLLIGLKSAVHFRADYGDIAAKIFEIDTPGVHNPDVSRYDYEHLRHPMWPLDEV